MTDPVRRALGREVLTVEEAQAALGIGRTKLFRLISAGSLASVMHGKRRYIATASVDRYIRARAEEIRASMDEQESASLRA